MNVPARFSALARLRALPAIATILLTLGTLQGGALGWEGPEWCDEGSPPPNDFRFRRTGGPSAGSSTAWLRSTTGGTLDLRAGVNTLTGGVARGMRTAIEHAPRKD